MTRKAQKPARPDIEYVNESLRDGLKVLRVLIAAPSRGYTTRDVERLTGLSYDFCRRALITFKLEGMARQFMNAWKPGDIRESLGKLPTENGNSQSPDVIALAGAMADPV